MTCIVAISNGKDVLMGGDSAGVTGWDIQIRADPKVFVRGEFVIGFTTSFRMGQLLRFGLNVTPKPESVGDYEYMVTHFVPAVRQCLKDGGFATREKEQEQGGTFLVGYRGHIYSIHDDYQVADVVENYCAVGCGASYALGALYASTEKNTRKRAEAALNAASRFSAGVRAPFLFVGKCMTWKIPIAFAAGFVASILVRIAAEFHKDRQDKKCVIRPHRLRITHRN
ncbi:MAG TPA: hypothetical protein VHQ47_08815 [Phycisphaerae bacterium]|jgi:ATP-dependent protease HslVU (ClpYQ) peptidase subunit|nr:hypothetical protein [Phycisphaerae bacterium]